MTELINSSPGSRGDTQSIPYILIDSDRFVRLNWPEEEGVEMGHVLTV